MNVNVEELLRGAGRAAPPTGIDVAGAAERGRALRRRRHVVQAGAAVLALVAGAGLAVTRLPPAEPVTTSVAGDDDPVLRDEVSDGSAAMEALVGGVLERDGQCLLLENGQSREVVVWPPGTRWSGGDETVVLSEGPRIRLGDRVTGSGGHFAADRESLGRLLDVRTVDRAVTCARRTDAGIAMFQAYSSINTD